MSFVQGGGRGFPGHSPEIGHLALDRTQPNDRPDIGETPFWLLAFHPLCSDDVRGQIVGGVNPWLQAGGLQGSDGFLRGLVYDIRNGDELANLQYEGSPYA